MSLRGVHHLPAYVAIERLAPGRVIVVVAPADAAGARRLLDAGAKVIVVGALADAAGLDVRPGAPTLPLADGSAHVVACIEGFGGLSADGRATLLREARRVLQQDGVFVAWAPQRGAGAVDFWTMERELGEGFARLQMVAQMPWQGFSLAPVLDDDAVPPVVVRESLLHEAPEATHYLALAGGPAAAQHLREALQCVLIPLDGAALVADERDDEAELRREAAELAATQAAAQLRAWEAEQLRVRQEHDERAHRAELARQQVVEQLRTETTEQLRARAGELAQVRAALAEVQQQEREHAQALARQQAQHEAQAQQHAEALARQQAQHEAREREHAEALARQQAQHEAREREHAEALARQQAQHEAQAQQREREHVAVQQQREHERTEALTRRQQEHAEALTRQRHDHEALQQQRERDHAAALEQREAERQALIAEHAAERSRLEQRAHELEARARELSLRVAELEARLEELDRKERERAAALEEARAHEGALQRNLDEARAWTETSASELAEARARADSRIAELRAALDHAQEQLRTRDNDVAVLTRMMQELEQSSVRNGERAEARARELEERGRALAELRARVDALQEERALLARQLEVAVVEREAARQLTTRLEVDLEHVRRRAESADEHLADRVAEAARLAAEGAMLRERVEQQERALTQARSRADELTASAAHSLEQGRVQAELAIDRDRLREELARRTAALEKLEERLWGARDEAQRERIEVVKLGAELERVREQLERARQAELSRTDELERVAGELRRLELDRAEALATVRTRDDELVRLRRELDAMASRSNDLQQLRVELDARSRELVEAGGALEQARGRERELQHAVKRREQQLVEAGVELERLRSELEHHRGLGGGLQSELDVRMLELEQLAAGVSNLQQQVETLRLERNEADARAHELQSQLEQIAAERELLRRHLREREQELADVASAQESSGAELYLLRRELESAAETNERLSESLRGGGEDDEALEARVRHWPPDAVAELQRLRAELAARGDAAARVEAEVARADDGGGDRARLRRLQLEIEIRAQEHEQVLAQLDAAEQRIWEMSDASDRNAARLAAGLAQLEKQREQLDDTLEELEVTRGQLAAAQARGIEQERLLASERAKLTRLGAATDANGSGMDGDAVDALFADLDDAATGDAQPILLPTAATLAQVAARQEATAGVPTIVSDGGSQPGSQQASSPGAQSGSRPIELRSSPRVVVEPLDDDAWKEPSGG